MIILSIDPGNENSGFVFYNTDNDSILKYGKVDNFQLKRIIDANRTKIELLVIEMLSTYGTVGDTIYETAVWIGRFIEFWKGKYHKIKRSTVRGFWTPEPGYVENLIKTDVIKKWPKTADSKIKIMLELKYKMKMSGKSSEVIDVVAAIALAGCFAGKLRAGEFNDKEFATC